MDHWYSHDIDIQIKEAANTFTLHSGCGNGTHCLLYAGCGRYLCVVEHPEHGPFLATSPLMLDINNATPLPKFLFDFVPCSTVKHTFSIRSHYNQKYVRYIDDEQKQEICDIYSDCIQEIVDSFPVDATEKTATEFTLSPIWMAYADTKKTELHSAATTLGVPIKNC